MVCIFLSLSYLKFLELLGYEDSHLLSNMGGIAIILSNILSVSFSSLFLRFPLVVCWYTHKSLRLLIFLHSSLFMLLRVGNLKWPIFKFTVSFFGLLKYTVEPLKYIFLISIIAFFKSRLSIWFLFTLCVSSLIFSIWWNFVLLVSFTSLYKEHVEYHNAETPEIIFFPPQDLL